MSMFDRCDPETMRIVNGALGEARRLGHRYLGTEHVLLAISMRREALPETVAPLLPSADAIRSGIESLIGTPTRRDTDLLRSIGIELDEVRAAVRRSFGDDAFDRLTTRRVHQPWQPWRRPSRRCTSVLAGTMSIARRLKQAFERARQECDRRGRDLIDPTLLLLGVVEVEDALANQLLRANGIDPDNIRALLVAGTLKPGTGARR
jgi:ATP-dependent Clp protease ATP-binding subunit ClpA